jgi:hypothetical protein
MPAGLATQRRKIQDASDEGHHSGHTIGGNALQVEIAADSAVRIKQVAKRNGPRVKTYLAFLAPPWQNACKAEQKVRNRPAPGSPEVGSTTGGADSLLDVDLGLPEKSRPRVQPGARGSLACETVQ